MAITSKKSRKTVAKPEMESDPVFRRQFELFVRSTDEKLRQSEQILRIIRDLPQKRNFLDVGAGSGEITSAIAADFTATTVLEPNPHLAKELGEKCPNFRILRRPAESAGLDGEQFDLILCSHVLCYVPEAEWMPVIRKMSALLAAGGKLVIVLQSPEGGIPCFFRKFAGNEACTIGLWSRLVREYGEARVCAHYGISRIKTKTLEEMTAIGLFLLLDKKYRRRKNEISRYFETHHRTAEGYSIDAEYITFEVTK